MTITARCKFAWGEPVSDHPFWQNQRAGGVLMAALVFGAAILGRFRTKEPMTSSLLRWIGVAAVAALAGTFVPLAVEKVPLESLGIGGWSRSIILLVLAIACPLAVAAALTRQRAITTFANIVAWPMRSFECRLIPVVGFLLVALTLVSLQIALGLVFDPRYKDFPYAPLSAAVGSLFILSLFSSRGSESAARAGGAGRGRRACAVADLYSCSTRAF